MIAGYWEDPMCAGVLMCASRRESPVAFREDIVRLSSDQDVRLCQNGRAARGMIVIIRSDAVRAREPIVATRDNIRSQCQVECREVSRGKGLFDLENVGSYVPRLD
ncbi:hypothetical protein Tco_1419803 [Tanacetum coccineum]